MHISLGQSEARGRCQNCYGCKLEIYITLIMHDVYEPLKVWALLMLICQPLTHTHTTLDEEIPYALQQQLTCVVQDVALSACIVGWLLLWNTLAEPHSGNSPPR